MIKFTKKESMVLIIWKGVHNTLDKTTILIAKIFNLFCLLIKIMIKFTENGSIVQVIWKGVKFLLYLVFFFSIQPPVPLSIFSWPPWYCVIDHDKYLFIINRLRYKFFPCTPVHMPTNNLMAYYRRLPHVNESCTRKTYRWTINKQHILNHHNYYINMWTYIIFLDQ